MDVRTDMRGVVIEAIATLVNIKNTMAKLLLEPAGVPPSLYVPILRRKDAVTGKDISKRQFAPLLLAEVDRLANAETIFRNLIKIAANWTSFELAHEEYKARATVQKAKEISTLLEQLDAQAAEAQARVRAESRLRQERERAQLLRQHLPRLLMMFDALVVDSDHQQRGLLLQELLKELFDAHGLVTVDSFTRNKGAEQIDGAFRFEGWRYIVECRWRERLADIRQLDGLLGQVQRSGRQTMGIFLSINGWSENVVPLLKQNPEKSIVLMDGLDLRYVLAEHVGLEALLSAKLDRLNVRAEPFYSVSEYLADSAARTR